MLYQGITCCLRFDKTVDFLGLSCLDYLCFIVILCRIIPDSDQCIGCRYMKIEVCKQKSALLYHNQMVVGSKRKGVSGGKGRLRRILKDFLRVKSCLRVISLYVTQNVQCVVLYRDKGMPGLDNY